MRMADIIRFNNKNAGSKRRFLYTPPQESRKSNGLQMKKLIAREEALSDDSKTIEELYTQYMKEMTMIFNRATVDFDIMPSKIAMQNLAIGLIDKLQLSNIDIMDFFMKQEEEGYLCSHSVNVTFMSIMVGIWLNYNKSDLSQLALAAIFHDVGMIKVLELARLPRALNRQEREEVERHPEYSKEFLQQMSDIDTKIIEAVSNHHIRLKSHSDTINEYSQIIGLVDTFEAMTHPRAYRKQQEPHTAIHTIIEELKGAFDSRITKALIDNIGIYPVGTWVRLDTEEIGLVIDVNSGFPLSPKVSILFNKNAERLLESRTIDLSKQANIRIAGPLEEEVKNRFKEAFFSK